MPLIETQHLLDITELMTLLGYIDERSVNRWCKKNKVPIFKIGIKKYTHTDFINQILNKQLASFAKDNLIKIENVIPNQNTIETIPTDKSKIISIKAKNQKEHSNASQSFLRNIKAA